MVAGVHLADAIPVLKIKKDLPRLWVKFAATLRAGDACGYLRSLHALIIAD